MDIVPVRRDGTGRLVAVGLIEVIDMDGVERWSMISVAQELGTTIDDATDRGLRDSLGPEVRGQRSTPLRQLPDWARPMRPARRFEHGLTGVEVAGPYAIEISGRIALVGAIHRFSWFLVTALPTQETFVSGQRELLADFLEAQGEPSLAKRLRQF